MSRIRPHDIVCLILCAGKGTRMRPLTYTRPKQLLPICNRPVIDHILEAVADVGIVEACLVVDPGADALRDHVRAHRPPDLRTRFVVQPEAKGIADAVQRARRVVGERPFVVYLGDSIYGDRIADFVARFVRGWPKGLLRLHTVEDPRQYGIALLDPRGRIIEVEEKPDEPHSDLAITGVYGFHPCFFDTIRKTKPGKGNELQITDAIRLFLPDAKGVYGEVYNGVWADAGRPSALLDATDELLRNLRGSIHSTVHVVGQAPRGQIAIGEHCRVSNSILRGPVLVGRTCQLTNAVIEGPCAINDGTTIADSRLSRSIVDRGAVVSGMLGGVTDSIIGVAAEVLGNGTGPGLASVVVGDDSRVRFG